MNRNKEIHILGQSTSNHVFSLTSVNRDHDDRCGCSLSFSLFHCRRFGFMRSSRETRSAAAASVGRSSTAKSHLYAFYPRRRDGAADAATMVFIMRL